MKDVKAFIFDFDGTIVDSYKAWSEYIYPEFFAHIKAPVKDWFDIAEDIRGLSLLDSCNFLKKKYGLDMSGEDIVKCWVETAKLNFRKHTVFKPHFIEFFELAKRYGIKMGIASNNFKDVIVDFLESQNMLKRFDAVVGQGDFERTKPHPDAFLKAVKDLGVSTEECIAFEDSTEGLMAAKAAKLKVIAVCNEGYKDYLDEITSKSDRVIESFKELINIFDKEAAV